MDHQENQAPQVENVEATQHVDENNTQNVTQTEGKKAYLHY